MNGTVIGPVVTPPESNAIATKLFGISGESARPNKRVYIIIRI